MKRPLAIIAMLIPFFVAAPVSAHHPADGIVTDDIYEMIEDSLLESDSPHLDMDLDLTVTMTVDEDDVSTVLNAIADALPGQGRQVESSIDVNISGPDSDGVVTITITENLGQGDIQVEDFIEEFR